MKLSVLLVVLGWVSVFALSWLMVIAPQVLTGSLVPIFVPWFFFITVAILAMGSMAAEKQKKERSLEKAIGVLGDVLASKSKETTITPRNQN